MQCPVPPSQLLTLPLSIIHLSLSFVPIRRETAAQARGQRQQLRPVHAALHRRQRARRQGDQAVQLPLSSLSFSLSSFISSRRVALTWGGGRCCNSDAQCTLLRKASTHALKSEQCWSQYLAKMDECLHHRTGEYCLRAFRPLERQCAQVRLRPPACTAAHAHDARRVHRLTPHLDTN